MKAGEICFNPRARVGRDRDEINAKEAAKCFNPRARVGRDAWRVLPPVLPMGFNPRARVGRDYMHFNYMHYIKIIQ